MKKKQRTTAGGQTPAGGLAPSNSPQVVIGLRRVWRVHTPCCHRPVDVPRRPFVLEHTAQVRCRRCKRPLRVWIRREGLDPSAEHRVSCPDCPLAVFAPFEWAVALHRQPGGALTAVWAPRPTLPWVWTRPADDSGAAAAGPVGSPQAERAALQRPPRDRHEEWSRPARRRGRTATAPQARRAAVS